MEDEVLDVVQVLWHGHPSKAGQKLFIRQTYLENEKFVTLRESHKTCQHLQARDNSTASTALDKYPVGQTVLVPPRQKSRHGLEPYEIVSYDSEGGKSLAVLRHLQRRREIDGSGRPNELVYTEKTEKFPVNRIQRTCLVRFYDKSDLEKRLIPAPYNRDGNGNAFYIITRLVQEKDANNLRPIEDNFPVTLRQGFDPSAPPSREPLRGMDLYCGGGNFGRGLEEGGAVHNEWAVDINKNAIHTYSVNLRNPQATNLFYGSVNDLLKAALLGNPEGSDLIPLPGDVDLISAGSPCQGFSLLNVARRNDHNGLKNQSLVASVAAYIDFYRPSYGILENVMSMAQKGRGRDEDVLSQLICAIAGLGYQVELFVLDAWSCGSPQSRSRLFVSFAAPGLQPLEHPQLSHSHPSKVTDRGLGTLANGESFGKRIIGPTPFEYVTAAEATKDLPRIGDACTYQCIREPDHVAFQGITTRIRAQIRAIPVFPRGMNFVKTWNEGRGVMTAEQRKLFASVNKEGIQRENTKTHSAAWGRINPKKLFPTITVSPQVTDSRRGASIHWDDHRCLTTMEARRAQGFPDDEVLLGTPAEGMKLMGNSVARTVALALGLSLRDAWLKNDVDRETPRFVTKAGHCSPICNKREDSWRSRIEIPIPDSGRRSTEADNRRGGADIALASSNIIKPCARVVAPNKARRSKIVPDVAASPTDEDSVDPQSNGFASRVLRKEVIPDSLATSGDEESLSEETFQRFLGSLDLRMLTSRDGMASSRSGSGPDSNVQAELKSLKRSYGMLQAKNLPDEMSRKVPKVLIPLQPSSGALAPHSPHPVFAKEHSLHPSTLATKLTEVKQGQTCRNPSGFSFDSDCGSESDEDNEVMLIEGPGLMNRVKSRTIQTPSMGRCKTPSKAKTRPQAAVSSYRSLAIPKEKAQATIVISLLTDDEDESLDATEARPLDHRSCPPPPKQYVPVDNSNFMAYAQTHQSMNNKKNRKLVAVK